MALLNQFGDYLHWATTNIQRLKEIPATDEIHMEGRNHGLP